MVLCARIITGVLIYLAASNGGTSGLTGLVVAAGAAVIGGIFALSLKLRSWAVRSDQYEAISQSMETLQAEKQREIEQSNELLRDLSRERGSLARMSLDEVISHSADKNISISPEIFSKWREIRLAELLHEERLAFLSLQNARLARSNLDDINSAMYKRELRSIFRHGRIAFL